MSAHRNFLEPFTLPSGIELKNRVLLAPMTNFLSNDDGTVSDQEIAYYKKRSGGVGAVITACAYVLPHGKGFAGEIGVDRDEQIPSLKKLADAIHAEGAKAILQIFHGGRMCPPELVPNEEILSASAVPAERDGSKTPRPMTEQEIQETINAFGEATRRAIEADFDGVELHGANTYLLQQFFSQHSNRREDKWGGSLENRMKFPLAVLESAQAAIEKHADGAFILGYRVSPEEREHPGITMEDTLMFVDELASRNLDYVHVSLSDFNQGSMREKDPTPRMAMIKDRIGHHVPVIGVGSLHTPDEVEKAIGTGVPLIALGREMIMEPNWIEKVKNGNEDMIRVTLSKGAQEELVLPDPLWNAIFSVPNWFPIVE
ncbi:MAG: NADH-dependent flavin oxidoreductase [Anaerobacillus sp.]